MAGFRLKNFMVNNKSYFLLSTIKSPCLRILNVSKNSVLSMPLNKKAVELLRVKLTGLAGRGKFKSGLMCFGDLGFQGGDVI